MLTRAGALRDPRVPFVPAEMATVSPKAKEGLWQLAQLTAPSSLSLVSKNKWRPSSHLASLSALSGASTHSGK